MFWFVLGLPIINYAEETIFDANGVKKSILIFSLRTLFCS